MRRGEQTWLNCSYDLERDQLYSIKWYKNNVEIYRYLPSETPRVKVYNMPGIHIDVSRSNISDLYLNDTDLNSEGKYRCEVSAESPSFQTERAQKEMIVYVLPYEDPVIKGLYSQYQLGDLVPTASEEAIHRTQYVDGEGLSYVQSRISFVAQPGHFWHGSMEIRCASHAALPYYVSSEELTIRDYGRTVDISGPRMNGPRLDGKKDKYTLGNIVDLSCNADGEAPIHGLKWLINDREAQDSYVSYSPPNGPGSTASTVLKLHFRLGEQHFSKGELRLKCVSKQLREFTAASEYRILSRIVVGST
ncbi:beat protein, putative [Ixodes scapularis]|uniref:Beat protein, putative n=1 Tax=Ixodes scapularis TaxID=6945 RepID=B7PWM7_IXOSC|nr:beat protein, putative [Ixodes scapularis]|eukprot:XP_002410077.1 beat protein, putative [Ixodes scapularis]